MKQKNYILSVTGSDSSGGSGIQSDIRTVSALGGIAVTAITTVTVQTATGILSAHHLPSELIIGQIRAIMTEVHPKAIKIGLINDGETIRLLRDEIVGCRHVVCDPGILSSHNERLADEESIRCLCRHLIPEAELLMLKCSEAELILSSPILTDEDMIEAAKKFCDMGAQWVMLRGRQHEGRLTALLYSPSAARFFSSLNVEGWQKHGVGGALSTAIATHLAAGQDMLQAISHAHDYIHNQVVYTTGEETHELRATDLYNQFLSLIAQHYRTAHDVSFYADQLSITPRYLSRISVNVAGQSPKQVIANYLMQEARILLSSTRLTVQEISNHLGFSSQASFSQFFRKQSDLSPADFRK